MKGVKIGLLTASLLSVSSLTAPFQCPNDCTISDSQLDDGNCDCVDCSDETDFTCATCGGCPDQCGQSVRCLLTPVRALSKTPRGVLTDTGYQSNYSDPILSFVVPSVDMSVDVKDTNSSCVGGIVVNGTEYIADGSIPVCASLNAAIEQCSQLADSSLFAELASSWSLPGYWNDSYPGGCEFLFTALSENGTFFTTTMSPFMANPDSVFFVAGIYPWTQSWNGALRTALEEAGAVEMTHAKVVTSGKLLGFEDVNMNVSLRMSHMQLTANQTLTTNLIEMKNVPHTKIHFSEVTLGPILCDYELMHFDNVESVWIEHSRMQGVETLSTYPMVFMKNCEVMLLDTAFVENSASKIVNYRECIVSMHSCTMSDNSQTFGVLFLQQSTVLQMTDSKCERNEGNFAGCIYTHFAQVIVHRSTFAHNVASSNGGALNGYRSQIEIDDCVFDNNTANQGGGLYAQGQASDDSNNVSVSNSVFTNNSAKIGGAIYVWQCTPFTVADSVFVGNVATDDGGALVAQYYTNALLQNCSFMENRAHDTGGGAAYFSKHADVFLSNCTFWSNSAAKEGGAVLVKDDSQLAFDHCVLVNNYAQGDGGAVFAETRSPVYAETSIFEWNMAANGGAIGSGTDIDIEAVDCNFTGNMANMAGALLCVDCVIEDCVITFNGAMVRAGAIVVENTLTIVNSTVHRNEAPEGGAFYVSPGSKTTVSGVSATINKACRGGFIAAQTQAHIDISDSYLGQNWARRGGCVLMPAVNVFRSENNYYFNNTAMQRGGALSSDFENTVSILSDVFLGNRAPNGAHIHSDSERLFEVYGTEFGGGECVSGGLHLTANNATFHLCNFTDNLAHETGGALLMRFALSLNMSECGFYENRATVGGAVTVTYSSDAPFAFDACNFVGNVAEERGAAVDAHGRNLKCAFSLTNSSFTGNVINEGNGGAVAFFEEFFNNISIVNSEFRANKAPLGYSAGIYAKAAESMLFVMNCVFEGNKAADENATALFAEEIVGVMFDKCSIEKNEGVFMRRAGCVQLIGNDFAEKSAITLLNSDKSAIGSLLLLDNVFHSTTAMHSFPVSLVLEVDTEKVCPKCELTAAVKGTDYFGNSYSSFSWCDLEKTCYDVTLEWAAQIDELMEPKTETDAAILKGNGQASFWLTPLKKHSTVHMSVECLHTTDVIHVCDFNQSLSTDLRVSGCSHGKYERDTGGGYFECERITSISADRYSWIADERYFPFLVSMAAIIALLVAFLYLKDQQTIGTFDWLCFYKRVERASFIAPAIYAWHCFDFLSDVNLAQSLFRVWSHSKARKFNEGTNWQWLVLATLSGVFVIVPFCHNLHTAWQLPKLIRDVAPNNEAARFYVKHKYKWVIFACLWGANVYASLQLANSRIFGLDLFYLGLTKSQLRSFIKYRVYSAWTENIPQLIIQVLVLIKDATDGDSKKLSITVLLSFISSLFSIIGAIFENSFIHATILDAEFEVTLDVCTTKEDAILSFKDRRGFRENQHRFRCISRVLSESLGIERTECQLGCIFLKGTGCVMYGQVPADTIDELFGMELDESACAHIWNYILGAESKAYGSVRLCNQQTPQIGRLLSVSQVDAFQKSHLDLNLSSREQTLGGKSRALTGITMPDIGSTQDIGSMQGLSRDRSRHRALVSTFVSQFGAEGKAQLTGLLRQGVRMIDVVTIDDNGEVVNGGEEDNMRGTAAIQLVDSEEDEDDLELYEDTDVYRDGRGEDEAVEV